MPEEKKKEEASRPMPWWGKVLLGIGGVYLISTKTPILEILNLFFYIVMVPIGLMMSIGLISSGAVQAFSNGWGTMITDVKQKVEAKAAEIVEGHETTTKKKTKAA